MKKLYLIGGTMGVGKTTTCQLMKTKLNNSVFLDGDWCWDMHPFQVTDETKEMVISNICYLLNNFLQCSVLDHVIFGWVMHEQIIIDTILAHLDTTNCQVYCISLVCDEQALKDRHNNDIAEGSRTEEGVQRSVERLPLYTELNTIKIDVSNITPKQAADLIIQSC